jgi:hypothetical protein
MLPEQFGLPAGTTTRWFFALPAVHNLGHALRTVSIGVVDPLQVRRRKTRTTEADTLDHRHASKSSAE